MSAKPASSSAEALLAPHFRNGRFHCPWASTRRTVGDLLRWQLRRVPARAKRPRAPIPVVENDGASLGRVAERAELTWIGHCSFALHEGEATALLDPHFGPRALVPKRWSPPGLPLASVPADAVALLSHNHYDHLDRWTLARLPKSIEWLVPLGLGGYLRAAGFARVRELDWWQEHEARGWRFTFLPAQHWSRRLSQPENSTLWGAWLVDTGRSRLFFGGDSGWFDGYGELGRRLAPLDAALLPIGAYLPRWFMQPMHMNPEEALDAFRALGARTMVPMHWGAFDLADDGVDEPPRALGDLLGRGEHAELAARVRILAVGERLELDRAPER
jgi:L-ascorbate metabolism protein UlaG (beta-lactamase superfamily)